MRGPVITRRAFTAGLVAAPAAGCMNGVDPTVCTPPAHAGAIDMHCHFFNAADVPVKGFVRHALFDGKRPRPGEPTRALLGAVLAVLARPAPTAAAEKSRGGVSALDDAADPAPDPEREFERGLADAIRLLEAQARGAAVAADADEDADAEMAPPPEEAARLLGMLVAIAGVPEAGLLDGGRPDAGTLAAALARRLGDEGPVPFAADAAPVALDGALASVALVLRWAGLMLDWRERIAGRYARLYGDKGMDPQLLRRRIDEELGALYRWCAAEEVPILAHARNSYAARPGYGLRANPLNWVPVLTGPNQPAVVLAHFGDFDAAGEEGVVWEDEMATLMDVSPAAHADLSFLSSAMDEPVETKEEKAGELGAFLQGRTGQVVFGTDWSLIGLVGGHRGYLDGLDRQLCRAGIPFEGRRAIFRENAIRVLGLDPGGAGRRRLLRFYADRGLDADRLSAFD